MDDGERKGPGIAGPFIVKRCAYFIWAIVFPMMFRPVPQTVHLPLIMGLLFLVVSSRGPSISRVCRHFTQYACISRTSLLALEPYAIFIVRTLRGNSTGFVDPFPAIFLFVITREPGVTT